MTDSDGLLAALPPLDRSVRAAYLDRLGLSPAAPSADALRSVVNRHVERVPYETLWIQTGELWGIDPHVSARRIATTSRGGYCYHHNGALGLLLRSLGFEVHAHVGAVHGPDGPVADEAANHLVLSVGGLPTGTNPGGTWYVDAGLGDALHDPLPLVAGSYRQDPFQLTLERTDAGWHLVHDPSGGFRGMHWTDGAARLTDFAERHEYLSTSLESGFVTVPMAERRDATGVDMVRGLVHTRIGSGAGTDEPVRTENEYFDLLAGALGMQFEPQLRPRLWQAAQAAHRAWLAAQGEGR
ncbi:MAG TPA: arylamine N-acetyltransferase [Jatrophihabitans sp.]